MENKRCIVTLANRSGNYINNLARLCESLRNNFDGEIMGFIGESSIGAPKHADNPYAFKVGAIHQAISQGYSSVLWLDTSCFAIKNVSPIFDEIERDGFIFQDAGHKLGTWSSDKQLEYFGITRDEAMQMNMIGNAGFLGFDFTQDKPKEFLNNWTYAMQNGQFKGSWHNNAHTESTDARCRGSRHDMTCSSAIANLMGIMHLAKRGDQWLQYGGLFDETINDSIIIKAQG